MSPGYRPRLQDLVVVPLPVNEENVLSLGCLGLEEEERSLESSGLYGAPHGIDAGRGFGMSAPSVVLPERLAEDDRGLCLGSAHPAEYLALVSDPS